MQAVPDLTTCRLNCSADKGPIWHVGGVSIAGALAALCIVTFGSPVLPCIGTSIPFTPSDTARKAVLLTDWVPRAV
jgi:hypothetical protein